MKWNEMFVFQRDLAVIRCGWRNKNNNSTPIGKRIANTEWDNLSEGARNVLIRYGYSK